MPWCHLGYSIDESRVWIEKQVAAFEERTAFEFVIATQDGTYLGGAGVNQIDTLHRRANLGYWVRTAATKQGVATRAVTLIRDWAFQNTDLVRLEIVIALGNVASHHVAERSRAVREGVLKRRLVIYDVAHDATMFSMTRDMPAGVGGGSPSTP